MAQRGRGWGGRSGADDQPPGYPPPPEDQDPADTGYTIEQPPEEPPPGTDIALAAAAEVEGIPAALLAQIEEAVASIPDQEGSGAAAIVQQLLTAKSIDDLNRPWNGTSGKELAGKTLHIEGLIKRPSDYTEGPSIFLVCDCVDTKTGQRLTMMTSAIAVIIQLAQAWRWGIFPITAEVVTAKKPTDNGYLPYHLNIIAANLPAPS